MATSAPPAAPGTTVPGTTSPAAGSRQKPADMLQQRQKLLNLLKKLGLWFSFVTLGLAALIAAIGFVSTLGTPGPSAPPSNFWARGEAAVGGWIENYWYLITVAFVFLTAASLFYLLFSWGGDKKDRGAWGRFAGGLMAAVILLSMLGVNNAKIEAFVERMWDKIHSDSAAPGRSATQDALLVPERCDGYVRTARVAPRKRITIEVGDCALFLALASESKVTERPAVKDERGSRIAMPAGEYSVGINNPPLLFRRELVGDAEEGYVVALWCPRGTKAPCKRFD